MGWALNTLRAGVVGVLLGLPGMATQAATSVLIWPVDPVIEAEQKAGALWLENRGDEPASLQVRVFAWRQDGFQEQFQAQREIIGSPPVANIAPGHKQLIRLTRSGTSPAGQEQAYRIIVDEIPSPLPNEARGQGAQAAIRLQMRYSVPLFVYGEGLWSKPDPQGRRSADGVGRPQLAWQAVTVGGKPYLELHNNGPVHARLTDVSLQLEGRERPLAQGLLGYVLPGARMRWPAPATVPVGGTVKARVNGDAAAQVIERGR